MAPKLLGCHDSNQTSCRSVQLHNPSLPWRSGRLAGVNIVDKEDDARSQSVLFSSRTHIGVALFWLEIKCGATRRLTIQSCVVALRTPQRLITMKLQDDGIFDNRQVVYSCFCIENHAPNVNAIVQHVLRRPMCDGEQVTR